MESPLLNTWQRLLEIKPIKDENQEEIKKMTKDNHAAEMPNEVWVSTVEGVGKCEPEGYWKNNQYPAVFKQRRDGSIKYTRANSLDIDLIERALWVMAEHGKLHHGENHNTVALATEALREIERAKGV